ncbi:MAG: flagellar motor protein MotB [Hyphomicrobium sp.]|nr:flagellar motor protein MotB [Hyphomicrobium sp.]
MSDVGSDLAREVVIVRRRRSAGEESHHGGAWKIAYADFMTAMMAFFLVMWLVSMTDDKTIVQIANYFNPLQLTDASPSKKGLKDSDPKAIERTEGKSERQLQNASSSETSPGRQRMDAAERAKSAEQEAALFADPDKSLDRIAVSAMEIATQPTHEVERHDSPQANAPGPDVVDPFDMIEAAVSRPQNSRDAHSEVTAPGASDTTSKSEHVLPAPGIRQAPSPSDKERGVAKAADAARAFEEKLKSVIAAAAGKRARAQGPRIEVASVAEGYLVSVMDKDNFEMFERGSAEPRPETLRLIEQLASVLRDMDGQIVVRGHTDARAFRKSSYDNWRLSTARAHMAHYMLRRAGVPDQRIERIEGLADRQPRRPSEVLAAENRRIELLVRLPQSKDPAP